MSSPRSRGAVRLVAAACLIATTHAMAAHSAAVPAGSPAPIAPFKCPGTGPNAGYAPQAMARSAERTLVLCADTEPAEGRGVVATAVAIHEPASKTPLKPIFAAEEAVNRLRVEATPDRGFALTLEALLPLGGPEYAWTPIAGFDVACGPEGCGERGARCTLTLSASFKSDLTGKVRQLARGGRIEPSVAQRLLDELTVQALLGEDVAAWTVEHFDRIVGIPPESKAALADARGLLARARDAGCDALVPPGDQPVVVLSQAERAAQIKEKIDQKRAGKDEPAKPSAAPAAIDLQTVAWLVGGRWEGQGKMADGSALHVEETYRWGPARRSIRFQAKNAGKSGAAAVEGILFFEPIPGKVILWNVKPGGGLSESAVTRADGKGMELLGPDGRVKLGLQGADAQSRTVEQLQTGTWTTVATAKYQRHPR